MTCLLCHEIDLSQLTFVELMLLKPKQKRNLSNVQG